MNEVWNLEQAKKWFLENKEKGISATRQIRSYPGGPYTTEPLRQYLKTWDDAVKFYDGEEEETRVDKQVHYRSLVVIGILLIPCFILVMGLFFLNDYIMQGFRVGAIVALIVFALILLMHEYEQKDK